MRKKRTFAPRFKLILLPQFQVNDYGNSNEGEHRPADRQNYRQLIEGRLSAVFREDVETVWQTGQYSGFSEGYGARGSDQEDVRQFGLYRRSAEDRRKGADLLYVQREAGDLRAAFAFTRE